MHKRFRNQFKIVKLWIKTIRLKNDLLMSQSVHSWVINYILLPFLSYQVKFFVFMNSLLHRLVKQPQIFPLLFTILSHNIWSLLI